MVNHLNHSSTNGYTSKNVCATQTSAEGLKKELGHKVCWPSKWTEEDEEVPNMLHGTLKEIIGQIVTAIKHLLCQMLNGVLQVTKVFGSM